MIYNSYRCSETSQLGHATFYATTPQPVAAVGQRIEADVLIKANKNKYSQITIPVSRRAVNDFKNHYVS